MKRASISETKNRLSALLDRVRQGQPVIIEDRGLPVARLEPVIAAGADPEGRLARLERQGIVRRTGSTTLPKSFFRARPPRRAGKGAASTILIDERREGR